MQRGTKYGLYCWLYRAAGIILVMAWVNQRQRYIVTSSLIGWAHTKNVRARKDLTLLIKGISIFAFCGATWSIFHYSVKTYPYLSTLTLIWHVVHYHLGYQDISLAKFGIWLVDCILILAFSHFNACHSSYVVFCHHNDVIMSATTSQLNSLSIVYPTVNSQIGADQGKYQSSASLAFVRGIHRWPVKSPHKWLVTRKIFHLMTSSCSSYVAICYHLCRVLFVMSHVSSL